MTSPENQPQRETAPMLGAVQLFAYGFLTMPLAMAGLALLTFLPTFYAVEMGLGLGLVGVLFVGGRLLDIITDPLIGHLSDQTRSRYGQRKPWMAVGIAGFCLSLWLLLVPPEGAGAVFLVAIGTAYFLFATMLDVPYSSVGLELSPHRHERSRLAGSKAGFQVAGAILAGSMPLLLARDASASLPAIAVTIVGFSLAGFFLFVWQVPSAPPLSQPPDSGLGASIRAVMAGRRYRNLLGSFFIVQAGNALFSGLAVLYINYILQAPQMVGLLIGLMFLATALALPLWLALARRIGKRRCWQTGIVISMIAFLGLPLLGDGQIVPAAALFFIIGGTFGCDAVMPTSMLADISADQEAEGGKRLSGMYLSVKNAASKMAFVFPMGLAFPVLGYLDFETTRSHSQTTLVVFMAFFAFLPSALKLLGLLVLRRGSDFLPTKTVV